jgi:ActR/RegA family two-component response regulator
MFPQKTPTWARADHHMGMGSGLQVMMNIQVKKQD